MKEHSIAPDDLHGREDELLTFKLSCYFIDTLLCLFKYVPL